MGSVSEQAVEGVTVSPCPPRAGHLFDLTSLSGRIGFTAAYSEKGLVFLSVCGENENCASGVGECSLPSTPLSGEEITRLHRQQPSWGWGGGREGVIYNHGVKY